MTIDEVIKKLQKLSDEGHGSETLYVNGFKGYDSALVPAGHVGRNFVWEDKIGVWPR